MAEMVDIKLDDQYDLAFASGDFSIGDATRQNQELILLSQKGMWKQSPICGVGLKDHLLDDADKVTLNASIQEQFAGDGMKVRRIVCKDLSNINVDAIYDTN